MKIIFFSLVSLFFIGCNSSKWITYDYVNSLDNQIRNVLSDLDKSSFAIKEGKKSSNIFALVDQCEELTTIVFSYTENMPKSVQYQIKKSRRVILIDKESIPVIFYFDDGRSSIREGGVNLGLIGGYLLQFNNTGEILMKGPVY